MISIYNLYKDCKSMNLQSMISIYNLQSMNQGFRIEDSQRTETKKLTCKEQDFGEDGQRGKINDFGEDEAGEPTGSLEPTASEGGPAGEREHGRFDPKPATTV